MKVNRNGLMLVPAVAIVAFIAGRMDLHVGSSGAAWAAPVQQDEGMPEMSPETMKRMQAMTEAGTPGEHHEHLNLLLGTWEGVYKFRMGADEPFLEMPGTASRKWVLDGHYIREDVTSVSEFGSFQGVGYIGYDNVDGQYVVAWMDNMSTGIMTETSRFDPETKTLTSRGSFRDPLTGKLIISRGEMDLSDPNRQTFVGYATGPDGKEFKSVEGTFERVK